MKELIKTQLSDLKPEFELLIKENGEKMYEGIFDLIDELIDDEKTWDEAEKEINDCYEEEDEEFKTMILADKVDMTLFSRFRHTLIENLISMGHKYNEEEQYWDIKDKRNGDDLTCYGVIWDYWYSVDTCVRETLGDIFEEGYEEYKELMD
jgi:hypothetical protein